MQFDTTYRVERYALDLAWDQVSPKAQERARMSALDLLGALTLGSRSRQFGVGLSLARSLGMSGDIPVIGAPDTFNLLGAAVACGHAANSYDIDDGYNMIKGHPGSSFVAGALEASAEADATWQQYLTTLVACYEVAMRWALAMQDHYGFLHSSGAYGAFGTALGIARVRGYSQEQLNNALSIADFHAPMVPVMRSVEYPSNNKDGVPFGALVGAMASLETEAGETGRGHLLELPEYAYLVDSLGSRYLMEDLYYKPYTCCRWAHQPIDCCLELRRQHGFTHDQVVALRVHTFQAAALLSKQVPHDTEEAQYNIAYPIAAAVVHGDLGYDQIRDEALDNPDVHALMERLSFVVDPEMEAQFPEKRLAWVEVELEDGSVLRSDVHAAPGEHTDPALCYEWVCDKFRRRTASVLESDVQERVISLAGDAGTPVRDIIDTINRALAR